jgi:hypothetical protein
LLGQDAGRAQAQAAQLGWRTLLLHTSSHSGDYDLTPAPAPPVRNPYTRRILGSSVSRRALPKKLKPSMVTKIARPGKFTSHGAERM